MTEEKLIDNLCFPPGFYEISKLIGSNILEIQGIWLVKLQGIKDDNPPEELKKWLKVNNVVRIIPHKRDKYAHVISDVWLGNTHINRQFKEYNEEKEK